MPHDQHLGFEEQVRALYDSMVRIEVTPTWVRLNDFQRTAPRAVERLAGETALTAAADHPPPARAPLSPLAAKYAMSVTAVQKHVAGLEKAALLTKRRAGASN
jgi:hypothetical protein